MKRLFYFCGVIIVIGMLSIFTSCGNDYEFYDEHGIYTTRAIGNNDTRLEIEVISRNIDNFASKVEELDTFGTASTTFSLKEGLETYNIDAITASSECGIVLKDTLCSV